MVKPVLFCRDKIILGLQMPRFLRSQVCRNYQMQSQLVQLLSRIQILKEQREELCVFPNILVSGDHVPLSYQQYFRPIFVD